MNELARNAVVAEQACDVISNCFSNWLHNADRIRAETISFCNDRFHKNLLALTRFAGCGSPNDLICIQSELASQFLEAYVDEGIRLMAMIGDMAMEEATALSIPRVQR